MDKPAATPHPASGLSIRDRPEKLTVKTSLTDHGQLEYSISGEGVPILFLHSGHGNCRETFFHKGFDRGGFQLITPSRPGYGNTPLPADPSPKRSADLIAAFLEKGGLGNVVVVGISAGGPTALRLAADHCDKVCGLILVSAVTKRWLKPEDPTYRKAKKLFTPAMEGFSWALFRTFFRFMPERMTTMMFEELSTYRPVRIMSGEVEELRAMIMVQRSKQGFMHDLDQEDDPATIKRITVPTLIMHSHYDRSVDISHAHHAMENIEGSKLRIYENRWGHLLWMGEEADGPIQDALGWIRSL